MIFVDFVLCLQLMSRMWQTKQKKKQKKNKNNFKVAPFMSEAVTAIAAPQAWQKWARGVKKPWGTGVGLTVKPKSPAEICEEQPIHLVAAENEVSYSIVQLGKVTKITALIVAREKTNVKCEMWNKCGGLRLYLCYICQSIRHITVNLE